MASVASPYFRSQYEVVLAATRVLQQRDELVRLHRKREKLREYISFMEQASHPLRDQLSTNGFVYRELASPLDVNHPAAFEIVSAQEALHFVKLQLQDLDAELADTQTAERQHLKALLALDPDLSNPDVRFLLQDQT